MKTSTKVAIGAGAAVAVGVAAPVAVTVGICALGFGAGGIAAGSWAAGFMASYGGSVAVGSACAIMQSIGDFFSPDAHCRVLPFLSSLDRWSVPALQLFGV